MLDVRDPSLRSSTRFALSSPPHREAGDVPARPGEARHQPGCDRIDQAGEDDGDRRSWRPLAAPAPGVSKPTTSTSTFSPYRLSDGSSERRSGRPSPNRVSMRMFWPSTQPSSARPRRRAPAKSGRRAEPAAMTPMRGTFPACCASAASGAARRPQGAHRARCAGPSLDHLVRPCEHRPAGSSARGPSRS